ncbi:MAG: NACHT domain-containing protein, partial [Proteobacteria bacterium]
MTYTSLQNMDQSLPINSFSVSDAKRMSLEQKKTFLKDMSEDDFRDLCIRPLFERRSLVFVRDTCGINEEGKDCVLLGKDNFDQEILIAVQTKKGNLTMAGTDPRASVNNATNQLDMALKATVKFENPVRTLRPSQVILCVSGTVNPGARQYIQDNANDPRIKIFDCEWVINELDNKMPEFWARIDKNRFPYLKALRARLLNASDAIYINNGQVRPDAPFIDEAYAPLYLVRLTVKPVTVTKYQRIEGESDKSLIPVTDHELDPKIEEFEAASILKSNHKRIVIVGEGGSGKTTAIRRLAYKLIERALALNEEAKIPVIFSASTFYHSGKSLLDYVGEFCRDHSNTDGLPFDSTDLNNGSVVFLIDGLEEIGSESKVSEVLPRLTEFQTLYPKCPFVITTRDYGFTRKIEG